jgi:hypothetical protein
MATTRGVGLISTIPAMPKGATGNLQYGSGKTYTVTATFTDGRSCSARFAYDTPAGEVEEKWAKAVAKIPKPAKPVPATERHKPTTEPFLTEWLALHKQHLKALRNGKKSPIRLADAAKLADAKYAVYLREYASRFPRSVIAADAAKSLRKLGFKANARKGVVRVTAKGKK